MFKYFLDRPEQIKISLTNICNYRCVMCYNAKLRQPRGFISPDLVKQILQECRNAGIPQVALGATGEPLLHKDYLTFLEMARDYGLRVSTTSNCSALTKEKSDKILDLGLSRLNISIYSATAEEHRRYTGLDNFNEVVENIKYFLESWHTRKSGMKVNMWFLQIPKVNNYEEYIKFWGPLAEKVGLSLPQKDPINWSGRVKLVSAPGCGPKFWIEYLPGRIVLCRKKQIRCSHVRSYLHILHNGDILPCCNIPESAENSEICFGNIKTRSIIETWKSIRYKNFKNNHYRKQVEGYVPCRICSDIQKIDRFHFPPMFLANS